jgi:hypothetical protein
MVVMGWWWWWLGIRNISCFQICKVDLNNFKLFYFKKRKKENNQPRTTATCNFV